MCVRRVSISTTATINNDPAMGASRRASSRLQAQNGDATRRERHERRESDKAKRGEPHGCQAQGCHRAAVHRGSHCEVHKRATEIDKNLVPLIYQGCPQFIPRNQSQLKWTPHAPKIAGWIEFNLDICTPDPDRQDRFPHMVLIRGWKGAKGGLHERKELNGMLSLPCLY
jgi:hypothetical protein